MNVVHIAGAGITATGGYVASYVVDGQTVFGQRFAGEYVSDDVFRSGEWHRFMLEYVQGGDERSGVFSSTRVER